MTTAIDNSSSASSLDWLSDLRSANGTLSDAASNSSQGKIPLQKSWTFWFFKPALSTSDDPEAYTKQLQRLDDFSSVQDFWACYNALPAPQSLQHRHCFHLMKLGVKPEWEDHENKNGGTWTFRVEKNSSGEVWRVLLLAAIGEQFSNVLPSDDICGITVKGAAPSAQQLIFQVWHKDEANKDKVNEKLKEIVAGSAELTGMFYKSNAEELSKANQAK